MNKKLAEIIKFCNDIRIKQGRITFDDLKREIALRWSPSDYYINSKIDTMKLFGLIKIDEHVPQVWVLHAFNERYDTKQDESEADNLMEKMN